MFNTLNFSNTTMIKSVNNTKNGILIKFLQLLNYFGKKDADI
jgi:hypothetical protein